MIKVTQQDFNRITKTMSDTAQKIANNPRLSCVEEYSLHNAALGKLLLELEVVGYLSSDEAIIETERIFHRINFLKGVSV